MCCTVSGMISRTDHFDNIPWLYVLVTRLWVMTAFVCLVFWTGPSASKPDHRRNTWNSLMVMWRQSQVLVFCCRLQTVWHFRLRAVKEGTSRTVWRVVIQCGRQSPASSITHHQCLEQNGPAVHQSARCVRDWRWSCAKTAPHPYPPSLPHVHTQKDYTGPFIFLPKVAFLVFSATVIKMES